MHHEPCAAAEMFVGNTHRGALPDYLRSIRSARLGNHALDIDGKRLPATYRPIFIARADANQYDAIMVARTSTRSTN